MDMYTTILVVVVALAAVAVAIYAARSSRKTKGMDSVPPTTEEARLEDRFARGEISESEYRRKLEELKEKRQKDA